MCFWVKRSTKSRNARGQMGVLDCIGMRVLGQMRHAKSRSVRRAKGFGVCFWLKVRKISRNAFGKMEFLDCFFD